MSRSFVLEHATGHSYPAKALTAVRYVKMELGLRFADANI